MHTHPPGITFSMAKGNCSAQSSSHYCSSAIVLWVSCKHTISALCLTFIQSKNFSILSLDLMLLTFRGLSCRSSVIQAWHSGFKISTSPRARFQMTTCCVTLHMDCIRLFLQGNCDAILFDGMTRSEIIYLQEVNSVSIFHATLPIDGMLDSWADHYTQMTQGSTPISEQTPRSLIAY